MKKRFINIKSLVQVRENHPSFLAGTAMAELPTMKNAFLEVEDGRIHAYGKMEDCPKHKQDQNEYEIIDASGKILLPSWCDSHTHLVYAGHRDSEFVDRIKGLSYQEIAAKGGGILNSALKLNECSEKNLFDQSANRLEEVMRLGTGAIEIKSGYGLTVEGELKMLRVIKQLREQYPILIKATFLGAHAVPASFQGNRKAYLGMLINEIFPIIKNEKLADFVDVFCEEGYFTVEDSIQMMEAGKKLGLQSKIHVNQFTALGGVKAAVEHGALSVDHLEEMMEEDIDALKGSNTMPVALPGCSYFLSIPYTPARNMIDAGLPLALATDFNPGSAPSGNMNQIVSAACIKMKMTPEEAINAATLNGAYAMGLEKEVGSITTGKLANLILTKEIPSYNYLPYAFGSQLIDKVYVKGEEL